MSLTLDPDTKAAMELAKRALADGGFLDVPLVMAALYHATPVKYRVPQLRPYLRQPVPRVPIGADDVRRTPALERALADASPRGAALAPFELFQSLLKTEAGQTHLLNAGMPRAELSAVLQAAGLAAADDASAAAPPLPPVPPPAGNWRRSAARDSVAKALSQFGRMLTGHETPRSGLVEMDQPLLSLIRTLSKMGRRNAIVVGYPGTGKSALVYELARRLTEEHPAVPAHLRDCDIFELSPAFLRAGASMVGQYEERIKELLGVLRQNPKIILFIDEIHSMFQSGMHHQGPFNEANEFFKSALAKGEFACVGCTTTAEFRHYIEPDGALMRRFAVIRLDPPSRAATLSILRARQPRLEQFYAPLRVPDSALMLAVDLTDEHVSNRYQPDKSIQLIDEACAWCAVQQPRPSSVDEKALWSALEDMIGRRLTRPGILTVLGVLEQLTAKIVGQDAPLREIAKALIAGIGGWEKRSSPRGVFMFCGPTGVGKTETALLLAGILSPDRPALLRIDCNTLQGSGHDSQPAVNRLLGPPPGYIGYSRGEGGLLSKIRDNPECVVLFDEIEKADPGVGKLLLQVIDEGKVDDSEGNRLDFRRAFLVFTTNAGSGLAHSRPIGFEPVAAPLAEAADLGALRDRFREIGYGEEFLARIRHFVVFQPLDPPSLAEVVRRQLAGLRHRADLRGYELEWEPALIGRLCARWERRFGVRHLGSVLRNRIVEQLSVADTQGELAGVRRILLRAVDNGAADPPSGAATRRREGDALIVELL